MDCDPTSREKAVRWYRLAAGSGMADAQHRLADLLGRSPNEREHLVRAHMWANLSAAAGSEESRELRDELERRMSATQVAKAQGRARVWHDQRHAAAPNPPAKAAVTESPAR